MTPSRVTKLIALLSTFDITQPTVGIDFLTKTLQIDNQTIRMQLWDTAGQQRFRSLIPGYIKDSDCCLIVLDASNKETMQTASRWIDFVKDTSGKDVAIFVVLNKVDCAEISVSSSVAKQFANENGVHFEEVSAKSGKNILQLFRNIAKALDKSNGDEPPNTARSTATNPQNKQKKSSVQRVELVANENLNPTKKNCQC